MERDNMLKDAREIKEKMIADSKDEAQVKVWKWSNKQRQQLKVKNAAMAELKLQVSTLSLSIAEKLLKDELSNKEAQTKLVEKLVTKLNYYGKYKSSNSLCKSNSRDSRI
jgi:F-type H+-transporting ATPase subunit b